MLKIKKRCNQIILKTKNPIKFNKKLIQVRIQHVKQQMAKTN